MVIDTFGYVGQLDHGRTLAAQRANRDLKIHDANVDNAAFKTIELLPKRKKMNN